MCAIIFGCLPRTRQTNKANQPTNQKKKHENKKHCKIQNIAQQNKTTFPEGTPPRLSHMGHNLFSLPGSAEDKVEVKTFAVPKDRHLPSEDHSQVVLLLIDRLLGCLRERAGKELAFLNEKPFLRCLNGLDGLCFFCPVD